MTDTARILVNTLAALENTVPMAPKISPILISLIDVYSTIQGSQTFVRELITKVNLFEAVLTEATTRLQQLDSKVVKVQPFSFHCLSIY